MTIIVAVLGVVLLVFTWILTAPLTILINTSQPGGIASISLKGIVKYSIYLKEDRLFSQYRVFFYVSEKDLFAQKTSKRHHKKKLSGRRVGKRRIAFHL